MGLKRTPTELPDNKIGYSAVIQLFIAIEYIYLLIVKYIYLRLGGGLWRIFKCAYW